MPEQGQSGKIKGAKKKSRGSLRAKAGLPAKAGRRKRYEVGKGGKAGHITSPEMRARAKWLSKFGLKYYPSWIKVPEGKGKGKKGKGAKEAAE